MTSKEKTYMRQLEDNIAELEEDIKDQQDRLIILKEYLKIEIEKEKQHG